jgi:hypothetical protein
MPEADPFTFQIKVNGVTLDETHVKGITEKLKSAMLMELAKIDTRGDLKAMPLPSARGPGGGRTAGMVIE